MRKKIRIAKLPNKKQINVNKELIAMRKVDLVAKILELREKLYTQVEAEDRDNSRKKEFKKQIRAQEKIVKDLNKLANRVLDETGRFYWDRLSRGL